MELIAHATAARARALAAFAALTGHGPAAAALARDRALMVFV